MSPHTFDTFSQYPNRYNLRERYPDDKPDPILLTADTISSVKSVDATAFASE